MTAELPITKDPASRYVPWTIGLMMFLAMVTGFILTASWQFFGSWRNDLNSYVTIEVSSPFTEDGTVALQQQSDRLLTAKKIHVLLDRQPGVLSVSLLSPQEAYDLIQPWLGEDSRQIIDDLPVFIEVEMDQNHPIPTKTLQESLSKNFSGVRVIDTQSKFRDITLLGSAIELVVLLLVAAIFVTAILTLSFSARTSLLIHKGIIELLFLLGASEDHIIKEFQRHALRMALLGALLAYGLFGITVGFGYGVFESLNTFFEAMMGVDGFSWIGMISLILPVLMGIMMVGASRFSIQQMLRRLYP